MRVEVAAARPRCPTVPALRSHFNQNEMNAPSSLDLSFVDTTELKISLLEGRVVRSLDRKVRNDKGSNWRVMILHSISKVAERYCASTMEQLAILDSCGGPSTIFTAFTYFLGGVLLQSTSTEQLVNPPRSSTASLRLRGAPLPTTRTLNPVSTHPPEPWRDRYGNLPGITGAHLRPKLSLTSKYTITLLVEQTESVNRI